MKSLFTLCVGLLCLHLGTAQNVNLTYENAQEIKKRTLLLVLPENSKMIVNDLAQEDSSFVKMYTDDMDGQRAALEKAVLAHWSFTDSVKVVSAKEAKSLQKKQPGRYAVMKIGENVQDRTYIHSGAEPPQVAWTKSWGSLTYQYGMRSNLRLLGVTTLTINLPKKAVEVYLPKTSASEGDFIYGVKQLNYLLAYALQSPEHSSNKLLRNLEVNADQLEHKTLLLDFQEIACTQQEIREVYPYPFKIVQHQDIEKALKNKDTDYLTITGSRIDPHRTQYVLSNTGDGTILSTLTEPTFNYGESAGYSIQVLYPSLKAIQLRRITKVK